MLNKEKFQDKGQGFLFANSGGVEDTTLLGIATSYKTGVSRKYKTLPERLLAQTFADAKEIIASVKYDGEGVFFYYEEGADPLAFNAPSGRARIGLPWMKTAVDKLNKAGIKKALLVGEIYLKTQEGKRSRVEDVIHTTISGTPQERETLGFAAYDIIMLDGKDLRNDQKNFSSNWEILGTIFGTDPSQTTHRVEGILSPGTEVTTFFKNVTETAGQEGIVVRYPNADAIFKIKPSITIDCVVIGYVEGEFEGNYGVTSLLCGLCAPDGKTIQVFSRVGSGFSDDLRTKLLEELSQIKTESPLNMSDSDGRPVSFVHPKLVVEIEGEALIDTNLEEKAITSQTLQWDPKETTYTFQGINPCPRLSHATLAKLREDKIWDDGGTRMEQALSSKGIEKILSPKKKTNTEHNIHTREVYTKKSKDEVAIRKILVVERDNPQFHRFTIHWTDYSPERKDLFKNEVAVADTIPRLNELLTLYRGEAAKRGWQLVTNNQ